MNLQEAIHAPNFNSTHFPSSFYPRDAHAGELVVEGRIPEATRKELEARPQGQGRPATGRAGWSRRCKRSGSRASSAGRRRPRAAGVCDGVVRAMPSTEGGVIAARTRARWCSMWGADSQKRKMRLVVVGHCRRNPVSIRESGKVAVDVAERFADGLATPTELRQARWKAHEAVYLGACFTSSSRPILQCRACQWHKQSGSTKTSNRSWQLGAAMMAHMSTSANSGMKISPS